MATDLFSLLLLFLQLFIPQLLELEGGIFDKCNIAIPEGEEK